MRVNLRFAEFNQPSTQVNAEHGKQIVGTHYELAMKCECNFKCQVSYEAEPSTC